MRAFAAFRAVLCLSTALMMAISWPLWVTGGSFPRVPWFGWVRLLPAWASWVRFVILLLGLIAASILPRWSLLRSRPPLELSGPPSNRGWNSRDFALNLALVLSAWTVLEDQFRLQPWMYQFLLMGFAIAACSPLRAATLCRIFVIAQYLHSGLSKLDHEFRNEMGRWFLFHFCRALRIPLTAWSGPPYDAIIMAMPCVEICVAVALAFRARRFGVAGAVALHAALLVILGPLGMRHSLNVLLWNVAMIAQVVLLFGFRRVAASPEPRRRWASVAASAAVIASAILPLGERSGFWDSWPSFALYSSSNERMTVGLSGTRDGFPFPLNSWGTEGVSERSWIQLDLRRWSLEERGVPLYPSTRALNGVAEALALRYRGGRSAFVFHEGHADRRTGERRRIKLDGLDAIRAHGDSFWLNAHPAR